MSVVFEVEVFRVQFGIDQGYFDLHCIDVVVYIDIHLLLVPSVALVSHVVRHMHNDNHGYFLYIKYYINQSSLDVLDLDNHPLPQR